ncbi:MAG: ATP-binding protein [Pseudomonadota bacterium]
MQRAKIDPNTLMGRYVLALVLLAAFAVTSHLVALKAMSGSEEASTAINLSGRQRMLSQRILALLEREQMDLADQEVTEALDSAIALFVRSHRALTEGADLGLSIDGADRRRFIYATKRDGVSLNEEVATFVEELAVLRSGESGAREEAWHHLLDLNHTDHILGSLDAAVHEIEDLANKDVIGLRRLSHLSLLIALVILLLEIRFIFWPAQREVVRSFHELMAALDNAEHAEGEVRRMLTARTSFFAGMSNDLQTPLKILRGYIEQVMKADLSESVARQLGLVQRASEQMERIIEDVLDVRLLEEGLMQIEDKRVQLKPLVSEVIERYRAQAERRGTALVTEINPAMPDWISIDPQRLSQILDNLVSNAVKFTNGGSINIILAPAGAGRWEMDVTDTGSGIPAKNLEHLFKRYEDRGTDESRTLGSSGLGLPICHDLARLMGGDLSVDSDVGKGSTFRVTLPLHRAKEPKLDERDDGRRVAAA